MTTVQEVEKESKKSDKKAEKQTAEKKSRRKEKEEAGDKKEKTPKVNSKARPLCKDRTEKQVYDLLGLAKANKALRIGANEVIKKLNKGDAELVFLAGDTKPFAIIEPIIHLCENKNRTFFFVPCARYLGKACGLTRPVAACAVIFSEQPAIKKAADKIREMMS